MGRSTPVPKRSSKRSMRSGRSSKPHVTKPLTAEEAKRRLKEQEQLQKAHAEREEMLRYQKELDEQAKRLKYEEIVAYEEAHPEIPFVFILMERSIDAWRADDDGKMWFRGVYTSRKAATEASRKSCLHDGEPVIIRRLPNREPPFWQSPQEEAYFNRGDYWSD